MSIHDVPKLQPSNIDEAHTFYIEQHDNDDTQCKLWTPAMLN